MLLPVSRNAAFCAATLLLSACGGAASEGSGAICEAFGGGASTVNAMPSAGGSVTGAPNAFDGSLTSFATYTPAAGNGTLTIRGTAQRGVVEPGGQTAGVLLTEPATTQTVQITISTYLEGRLQATGTPGAQAGNGSGQTCRGICENRNGLSYFAIETTAPFDAIEATLQVSGSLADLQVRELCSR